MKLVYRLLNKPYGVLTRFTDPQGRPTLADYVTEPGIYALGRLDLDSEGLLLLSNDKRLQTALQRPGAHSKSYWVQVEGLPDAKALESLREGVVVQGERTLPARVKPLSEPQVWPRPVPVRFRKSVPTSWLEIEVKQGRNRMVRRMTAAVGFPTLRLIRRSIGELQLGELQPGERRDLTPAERKWVEMVRAKRRYRGRR